MMSVITALAQQFPPQILAASRVHITTYWSDATASAAGYARAPVSANIKPV
jgi:hypothetical protein